LPKWRTDMSRLRDSMNLAACLLILVAGVISYQTGRPLDVLPLFICAAAIGLGVLFHAYIERSQK